MDREQEELFRLKMKEKLTQYFNEKLRRTTETLTQLSPSPIPEQLPDEVQRMREMERIKLMDRLEQINQDIAMLNLLL